MLRKGWLVKFKKSIVYKIKENLVLMGKCSRIEIQPRLEKEKERKKNLTEVNRKSATWWEEYYISHSWKYAHFCVCYVDQLTIVFPTYILKVTCKEQQWVGKGWGTIKACYI